MGIVSPSSIGMSMSTLFSCLLLLEINLLQTEADRLMKLMGKTLDQAREFLKENEICQDFGPSYGRFRITLVVDQSYKAEDENFNRVLVRTENDKIVKIYTNESDCDERH